MNDLLFERFAPRKVKFFEVLLKDKFAAAPNLFAGKEVMVDDTDEIFPSGIIIAGCGWVFRDIHVVSHVFRMLHNLVYTSV